MTKLSTALLLVYAAGRAGAAAPDFLPLEQGNQWTYRSSNGEAFRISVGAPVMHSGNVYHRVTGYAAAPLFIRRDDKNGDLYWLDEEKDSERLLTRYQADGRAWYDTEISGCPQSAQTQPDRQQVRVPAGSFNGALELQYQSYGASCGDRGLTNELYLDNLGLIRRTVTTIAGPRTFELEYARVGALRLHASPGTSFRVGVAQSSLSRENNSDVVRLPVSIHLSVDRSMSVPLRYTTSQRFDVQIRNAAGEVVYRWSDDIAFAQAEPAPDFQAYELEHRLDLPLRTREGVALPDGTYSVEAWLTTEERQFSGVTTIQLTTS